MACFCSRSGRRNPELARMACRVVGCLTTAAAITLLSWPAAAADFATYRAFTLGTSTADVLARTGASPRDVTKLHDRPALLEELSWRLPYRIDAADRDSVAAIVFSFVDDQLFRMAVDY